MASISAPASTNYQTIRLGPGRRKRPGEVVCVMELASMLAGERFSDRPKAVCAMIASLLRAYNDAVDARRRGDMYRCAANAVGTRGDIALQERRARFAIHWARMRYDRRKRWRRMLRPSPQLPRPDDGPDRIAAYVVGSLALGPRGWVARNRRGWSEADHGSMLRMIDYLITMGPKSGLDELLAELTARVQEKQRLEQSPARSATAVPAREPDRLALLV
jgi:hypothetical protein